MSAKAATRNQVQQKTTAAPAAPQAPVAPVHEEPQPAEVRKTTPIDEAIERDLQEKTTVQVRGDTRKKLDDLKNDLDQPDVNGVISVLIDSYPGKVSTDDEVTLVMPRRRLDWLMAWQRNSDCSELLKTSVR